MLYTPPLVGQSVKLSLPAGRTEGLSIGRGSVELPVKDDPSGLTNGGVYRHIAESQFALGEAVCDECLPEAL